MSCAHLSVLAAFLLLGSHVTCSQSQPLASTIGVESAAHRACPGIPISIRTDSELEAQAICRGALTAIETLGHCGLRLNNEIKVVVTNNVYFGSRFKKTADFMPGTNTIRIASLQFLTTNEKPEFLKVPISWGDLYVSLAVHEVAHAIFWDNTEQLDLPQTAHEYVAYSAQVASMPEDVRDRLLFVSQSKPARHLFEFSFFLMLGDPHRFGVHAYNHFRQQENGCAFITQVMQRRVNFPPPGD